MSLSSSRPGRPDIGHLASLRTGGRAASLVVAGEDLAARVRAVLARPEGARRVAARQRAERYDWAASVDGFLAVHLACARRRKPT